VADLPEKMAGLERNRCPISPKYAGMREMFRRTVQECLPKAKVVADEFHMIRHINAAVDKVRNRHRGGDKKGKIKNLFPSRYILFKRTRKLADWEREKLCAVLPLP